MTAKELRASLRDGTAEKAEFCQRWWHGQLTDSQRDEFDHKYRHDDIADDLLTLSDEDLIFSWAVFKM